MENFIPKAESFIKGYKAGDRITLLNTVYVRAQKEENGRYGSDYLYLISIIIIVIGVILSFKIGF